jgi:predicted P-loop ATPase
METLIATVGRYLPLKQNGAGCVAKCPFHNDDGESLRVDEKSWRCIACGSHDGGLGDAAGWLMCWSQCSREEAEQLLGNGELPELIPIQTQPLKQLPFWGWRWLDKLPGARCWIHENPEGVHGGREFYGERVHLGTIEGRPWDDLSIVAGRECILLPINREYSMERMDALAAALYAAGHAKVKWIDPRTQEDNWSWPLGMGKDEAVEFAKKHVRTYPQINAAPQGKVSPDSDFRILKDGSSDQAGNPVGAAPPNAAPDPAPVSPSFSQGLDRGAASKQAVKAPTGSPEAPPALELAPGDTPPNLILGVKGEIKACEHNAKELMAAAKQYDCLHFDKFLYRVRLGERDWSDADDRDCVCWLQSAYRVAGFTLNQARTAAMALAHARSHDSLFEFVMGLPEWDGSQRIERAFTSAWGAPDDILTCAASRNFFIALHARAVKPGAQVDNLWAIEGPQGKLKSASLRALGEHFHAEISAQIGTTDFLRELRGVWIAELSELDSLRGREASTVKRLLSAPSDRFVEKFEKHATSYPRRAVAVATTNEATYWQDSTGARRLIPIRVGNINLDIIRKERLQWFAEARHQYQAGATWWEFPEGISGSQEARQAVDPWEDALRSYIDNGRMDQDGYAKPWPEGWVASSEIMADWLRLNAAQLGKASSTRLGHVMRRLDFEPRRSAKGDARGWAPIGWRRGDEPEPQPPA